MKKKYKPDYPFGRTAFCLMDEIKYLTYFDTALVRDALHEKL